MLMDIKIKLILNYILTVSVHHLLDKKMKIVKNSLNCIDLNVVLYLC